MPINENNAHDNEHTCYCCASGGGKTVAVKLAGLVGKPVAIFDPYGDYRMSRRRKLSGLNQKRVYHYTTRRTFLNAFYDAWKSRKPFQIAYQPVTKDNEQLRAEAIWFADLMWAAADGRRRLHVVFEEIGKYVLTTGAERSRIGELVTGGRKFGLVVHTVFQRPSEVPKTLIANSERYVIGAQQNMAEVRYWAGYLDCDPDDLVRLGQLNTKTKKHYLFKYSGIGNYQQKSIQF